MPLFTLFFLLGDLSLQALSHLPDTKLIILITLISVIIFIFKYPYRLAILGFALGFAFTYQHTSRLLSHPLPLEVEGKPILLTGSIASLPTTDEWQTHFYFSLDHTKPEVGLPQKSLIKLSWGKPTEALKVGDKWQFTARLKRIHGLQNPGGFDYEAWSLQRGVHAAGSVIPSNQNHFLSAHPFRFPIESLRQQTQMLLKTVLPNTATAPWLQALIIGERQNIPASDWLILRNTGTNHLMAIAGLHIGMMAGFIHFIAMWCWRRSYRLCLWIPAQEAGLIVAGCFAIFYSALAGFSIPTERACLMFIIIGITILRRRQIAIWHPWSLAMLTVLLINPLSILTESFWLSFGTIALIIYGMSNRFGPHTLWWKWGRVQWVIGLGLVPLSLYFFQEASLISFLANTIAIPWLSFLVLPFCLLASFSLIIYLPLAKWLLIIANHSLAWLWLFLSFLAKQDGINWAHYLPLSVLPFAVIAAILWLMPAGMPGRYLSFIFLLPLFYAKPIMSSPGEMKVTLLDVGQGLSVVVQTASHALIFDTGPRFGSQFDMGESVVLPYLRTQSIKQVDKLIVSHGDNDHIGGAGALIHARMIKQIETSVPEKFKGLEAKYCLSGEQWQWDGVNFMYLYPSKNDLLKNNNSSCVLRITSKHQTLLLTGDIEKWAQQKLVLSHPDLLKADILVAPHHGSKTSGVQSFIDAVHPRIVLYGVGYRNRYHFPHPQIVSLYQAIGAQQFETTKTGALTLSWKDSATHIERYRDTHRRYWFD